MRVDHPGGPLVPIPMQVEYDVYERLWRSPIPVAEPLWYAEGVEFADGCPTWSAAWSTVQPTCRGSTTRRATPGRGPAPSGLLRDGREAGDGAHARLAVVRVRRGAVHAVRRRHAPSREELHHWRALWAESRTDPFPMITEATYWLEEQLPPAGRPAQPAKGQQRRRRGDLEGRPHRRAVRLGAGIDRRAGPRLGVLPGPARPARPRRHAGALRRARGLRDRPATPGVVGRVDQDQGLDDDQRRAARASSTVATNRVVRPALGIGVVTSTERWLASALGDDVEALGHRCWPANAAPTSSDEAALMKPSTAELIDAHRHRAARAHRPAGRRPAVAGERAAQHRRAARAGRRPDRARGRGCRRRQRRPRTAPHPPRRRRRRHRCAALRRSRNDDARGAQPGHAGDLGAGHP